MSECRNGQIFRGEPITFGYSISVPLSSSVGSTGVSTFQPLLTGSVFSATDVLIGAELLFSIAKHLFHLENVSVIDNLGQHLEMPVSELHDFLRTITACKEPNSPLQPSNSTNTITGIPGERGFLTPLPPEAPLSLSLYVSADFSNKDFSPIVLFILPILSFPGIRGGLPILIAILLSIIFTRAVEPPENTGAKPLRKPERSGELPINITSEDLLKVLNKFGKYFVPK